MPPSSRESVALALPGFGRPRPEGFAATKDAYVDWLLGELDGIEGPIDLVGHDWGAILTYRVATAHGDRLQSWAADCGNLAHPRLRVARLRQDLADPRRRGGVHRGAGRPVAGGAGRRVRAASGCRTTTRSRWRPAFDLHHGPLHPRPLPVRHPEPVPPLGAAGRRPWRPGWCCTPPTTPSATRRWPARWRRSLGARFEPIEGAGHFWPYQAPEAAVAVLESFWASVA